jgi:hypothetical protein
MSKIHYLVSDTEGEFFAACWPRDHVSRAGFDPSDAKACDPALHLDREWDEDIREVDCSLCRRSPAGRAALASWGVRA